MSNDKTYLNGFGLITYNLHNGGVSFKELKIDSLRTNFRTVIKYQK